MDGLPPGTTLFDTEYVVNQLLLSDGLGNSYLAKSSQNREVLIREFYPETICQRLGTEVRPRVPGDAETLERIRALFVKEAHRLAQLSHSGILSVHDVFEDNGTAYHGH